MNNLTPKKLCTCIECSFPKIVCQFLNARSTHNIKQKIDCLKKKKFVSSTQLVNEYINKQNGRYKIL